MHRGFAGPVLVAAALGGVGCGEPVPASSPLAPTPKSEEHIRQTSTRAVEQADGTENKELEKEEAPPQNVSDDDDDSTVSSSLQGRGNGAGECKPSLGPPPDCTRLPEGSSTCMGRLLARRVCETVAPSLDPKVSGLWMTCMRQRVDKSRECDTSRIFDCGLKAIETACVDGTQRKTCAAIAKSCSEFAPEITTTVCERALGAWRPEKRDSLLECLHHGCEIGDFGACLP